MRTGLVAICLIFTGCIGKSDRPRVRIAVVITPQNMPIFLADTLGYYKDEDLAVTLENLSSGAKALQALIGGSVDVASITYPQAIQMAAEGQRVRAFFIELRRIGYVLVVAPAAGAKIHRVEDLKGAVIGIPSPGSPTHLWVNYLLAEHGVHPSDFSAVGIGIGASAVAAVESGRIDAAGLTGGDHLRLLRYSPSLRILIDGSSADGMRETFGGDLFPAGAVTAKQEWLNRNSDTARRPTRALTHALQWISTRTPEEIRARLPDSLRSQDSTADLEIIHGSLPTFTTDGAMPKGAPEAMKRYLDAAVDSVRNAKVDLAATWTNEFLPGSK
jgi:NitT/TauT family transport system substrate-binding protein